MRKREEVQLPGRGVREGKREERRMSTLVPVVGAEDAVDDEFADVVWEEGCEAV